MNRVIALVVILLLGFYVAWPGWSAYQLAGAIKAKDQATLERKISFPDVRESLKPVATQKVGEAYQQLAQQAGPAGAAIVSQIKADVVPKITETALTQLVTAPNLIRVVNEGGSLKDNAERILKEQIGKIGLPGLGGGAGGGAGGGGAGGGGGLGGLGKMIPGGLGGLGDIAGKMGIDVKQLPGIGGLGGSAPAPVPAPAPAAGAPAAAGEAAGFGLSNIKKFSFLGPLAFEIGVAKDVKATEPDVTVEMRFVGGDWRVVGVKPRI